MGEETRQVRFRDIGELPPGKFNDVEPCPDCARLRGLLGEAYSRLCAANLFFAQHVPATSAKTKELLARIAAELEGGK